MKRLLLIAICLVLLAAGCIGPKDSVSKNSIKTTEGNKENLIVTISSPKAGEILQGNDDFTFSGNVKGGKGPYTYSWSSSIDGALSTKSTFRFNPSKLSKGHHMIGLKAKDAEGSLGHGSVLIEVM